MFDDATSLILNFDLYMDLPEVVIHISSRKLDSD